MLKHPVAYAFAVFSYVFLSHVVRETVEQRWQANWAMAIGIFLGAVYLAYLDAMDGR